MSQNIVHIIACLITIPVLVKGIERRPTLFDNECIGACLVPIPRYNTSLQGKNIQVDGYQCGTFFLVIIQSKCDNLTHKRKFQSLN